MVEVDVEHGCCREVGAYHSPRQPGVIRVKHTDVRAQVETIRIQRVEKQIVYGRLGQS